MLHTGISHVRSSQAIDRASEWLDAQLRPNEWRQPQVNRLAADIATVASEVNEARLRGFLAEPVIQAGAGGETIAREKPV
jgi:hypothetical protein